MIALLAPGQGSQAPGMLSPWLEVPGFAEHLGELGEAASVDLLAAGTTWNADQIRRTEVSQPLIVGFSLAVNRLLTQHHLIYDVTAGHSVGEWTVAAIAGVLPEATTMRLVAVRASAMAVACDRQPTAMAAILGGELIHVMDRLRDLELSVANNNGVGQIVAAGATDVIDKLVANPPLGSRVRLLPVAGAFHTAAMQSAVSSLVEAAEHITPGDPTKPVLTNADGRVVNSGAELLDLLINQVARPVRWDLCQRTLADRGTEVVIELAPAATLSALAKRNLPGVMAIPIRTPDDIESAAMQAAARVVLPTT